MKKMKIKRRFFKRVSVFLFLSLIGTIFILNPNIIEATTVENEAEQLIELPTVHSNFYKSGIYSQVMETSLNNAEFVSLKGQKYFPNVNKDTEYQINYEVNLPELAQNIIKKEIVIAVDVSSYMEDSWAQVKDALANQFENSLGSTDVKIGIVPFNNQVVKPDTSHNNDFDFTNMLDLSNDDKVNINMIKNVFGWDYIKPDTDVGTRSIHSALDEADKLFESSPSKNEVLIIITSGGYDNVDETKLKALSQKSYDVVTYDVAGKKDQSKYSALEVHQILGGKTNKFFKINSDLLESGQQSTAIRDQIMEIIRSETANPNSLTENLKVDLKFNFGEYIEYVENSYRINDTSSRTYVENEKTVLPLYHGTLTEQDDLMKDIDFEVKVKDLTSSVTFTSAEFVYQYGDWPPVIEKIESPKFGIIRPHIYATLPEDWNPPITTLGDEVEVKYELDAADFEYDSSNNADELKEVVVVVDSDARGGFHGKLFTPVVTEFGDFSFDKFLKQENIKLGLVVYKNSGKEIVKTSELTINETEKNSIIKDIQSAQDFVTQNGITKSPLQQAADMLKAGKSTNKSIIIINFEDINVNVENLSSLKDYNIFTLDKNSPNQTTLKLLHENLFGHSNNYISVDNLGNHMGEKLKKLLGNLKDQILDTYTIMGTKLVFDVGNDLESSEGKKEITIPIEEIKYKLENDKYVAQNISITFKVKSLKTGDLKFRENTSKEMFNYISYSDFGGNLVQLPLDTPTIRVKSNEIIKHGLYLNTQGSNEIIQQKNLFTVVPSMNYTFGMTMDIKSSNAKFTIEIPKSIGNTTAQLNDVYIYELTSQGVNTSSKQSLDNAIKEFGSNYYITNSDNDSINLEANKNYLITYSVKFNNEESNPQTSSFKFVGKLTGSSDKEISLELKDFSSLPDLF